MLVVSYRLFELPWTSFAEDDQRLKNITLTVLLASLVMAIIIPWIPLARDEHKKIQAVPPRLAQLVLKKQKPKPQARQKQPEPKKVKKVKKVEKPRKEPKLENKPKKIAQQKPQQKTKAEPKPTPKPKVDKVAEARKKASSSGLLAFSDELADLRDDALVASLGNAQPLVKGEVKSRTIRQKVLTSGSRSSGGIDTSRLRADIASRVGDIVLAERKVTQVSSNLIKVASSPRSPAKSSSSAGKPTRTYEEITLVIDKSKGAIFALYNRALRNDPTLQGKVLLEITITADGHVISCNIVSSELREPVLERKLVSRIQMLKFAARDVETMVVTYPIDFLPS